MLSKYSFFTITKYNHVYWLITHKWHWRFFCKFTPFNVTISEVSQIWTWHKKRIAFNLLKPEMRSCNQFEIPVCQMQAYWAIFVVSYQKLHIGQKLTTFVAKSSSCNFLKATSRSSNHFLNLRQRLKVINGDVCKMLSKLLGYHRNVPQNKCRINYPSNVPTKAENMMKIGPVYSEIFGATCQFLLHCSESYESHKICTQCRKIIVM